MKKKVNIVNEDQNFYKLMYCQDILRYLAFVGEKLNNITNPHGEVAVASYCSGPDRRPNDLRSSPNFSMFFITLSSPNPTVGLSF